MPSPGSLYMLTGAKCLYKNFFFLGVLICPSSVLIAYLVRAVWDGLYHNVLYTT